MEIDEQRKFECPTIEELSAWFDEELESEDVEQHVATCPTCKKCLQEFQSIDRSIDDLLKVDGNTLFRIGQKCIREISKPHPPATVKPFFSWTKVAATLVVVGVVFFMSQSTEVVDSNVDQLTATDDFPVTAESEIPFKQSTANQRKKYQEPIRPTNVVHTDRNSPSQRPLRAQDNSRMDVGPLGRDIPSSSMELSGPDTELKDDFQINTMTLLGYEINDAYISVIQFGDDSEKQWTEDCRFHHTWIVDDPVSPLIFLKTLLIDQQSVFDQLIQQDLNRYHLKLRVTEKNFQDLVGYLEKLDCDLLPPNASGRKVLNATDVVGQSFQYDVDFVRR